MILLFTTTYTAVLSTGYYTMNCTYKARLTEVTFCHSSFLIVEVHYQESTLCPIKNNRFGLMGHHALLKLTFKAGTKILIRTYQVLKMKATS